MSRFRFYHIADKYIRFLHSGDKRVQYNKNQARPYVGIVLEIDSINYYVPLESPKPNHANIKSGAVLKLKGGKYGLMGFNNMIPVPNSALIDFDFNDIEDQQYRSLLQNQLDYCNSIHDIILHRARETHRKAVVKKIPHYRNVCCDFRKLESMCRSYNPNYNPKRKK